VAGCARDVFVGREECQHIFFSFLQLFYVLCSCILTCFFLSLCVVVMPVEYFPYFHGKYLAVAASLNGGNALAAFVCMLQKWIHELGFNVTQCEYSLVCYPEVY
jgi:pheromone shutdown protein TraB